MANGQVRSTERGSSSMEVIGDFDTSLLSGEDKSPILAGSSENGKDRKQSWCLQSSAFCCRDPSCERAESRIEPRTGILPGESHGGERARELSAGVMMDPVL